MWVGTPGSSRKKPFMQYITVKSHVAVVPIHHDRRKGVVMGNLIERDDLGNWGVKGLPWNQLYVGCVISKEVHDKLYGCLCKLMEYESTGLTPAKIYEKIDGLDVELGKYHAIGTVEEFKSMKENGAFTGMELAQIAAMQMKLKEYQAIGTMEECRVAVERMKGNWILCSDQLPEEKEVMIGGDAIKSFEMVWVALENGSEVQAHLEDGRWYSFGGYLVKEAVVAWHPAYRPPRYKAEKV